MSVPTIAPTSWLRRFRPAPAPRARLVCFPHAGGSATYYYWLGAELAPDIDVLAIQYPGRQDRRHEPAIEDLLVLAEHVFRELVSVEPGPCVFFGHSMGAIVAYEVARRMERDGGQGPLALIVSGRRDPASRVIDPVHRRDDDGIVAEIAALSGTANSLLGDEELLRLFLPAIRSDYCAVETYRRPAGPPLRCPVTVFTGDRDPQVTPGQAQMWREHTSGEFDLTVFPGEHFYLNQQQGRVARQIRTIIDNVV